VRFGLVIFQESSKCETGSILYNVERLWVVKYGIVTLSLLLSRGMEVSNLHHHNLFKGIGFMGIVSDTKTLALQFGNDAVTDTWLV